jgi:hypothetical protein
MPRFLLHVIPFDRWPSYLEMVCNALKDGGRAVFTEFIPRIKYGNGELNVASDVAKVLFRKTSLTPQWENLVFTSDMTEEILTEQRMTSGFDPHGIEIERSIIPLGTWPKSMF